MVKSARPVLLASSVKCCLNEARGRGTENPEPESKVTIMPGECWWRCQGWWGEGWVLHTVHYEKVTPARPAATHGARTHMFYPVRGAAGRGQLIMLGVSSSRTRSDFHDMIEVCWRPCGRLPGTRCTETRPDLGALLGCTKADTAARTGDHYSHSRHVAAHRSWERLTSNLN